MIRTIWLLLALAPAQAGAFELAFPVQCTLNDTCFIQQYPDHDPGPAATDFTCGPLSYDGHDGTDIAVPTLAAMAAGVAVLAAAPGTVAGVRDGMRDGPPGADVKNRECGNGVLIDHADGWQTQYCHMRQGSIGVRQGDSVAAGSPLGLIGQSGLAEFPHLHLSVRSNGVDVDPFAPGATSCGPTTGGLWADAPPYAAGGIIDIGLASEVPDFDAIKAGLPPADLTTQSPALVVWAHVFGSRAGDSLLLDITGPDGAVITERVALDRTQARLFRAVGRHLRGAGWPAGTYTGTARMLRDGAEIGARQVSLQIGG